MAFDFDQALASTDFRKAFAAAPTPQDAGVFRDIADTGLQLAQGVLQGGNMLASTFGADNAAAQAFKSGAEWLASNFSDELKWKQLTAAQDMRAAELSGSTWEEIKAGARAIGADPVGFLANAAGTTIPTIAAAFLPGGQGALLGRLAATSMVGAAQGAGSVKAQIYDTVEEAWKKQGASDEEAQARATAAQEYLGSNAGQIALGTALGALAGGSGVEAGVIGRRLLGSAAQDAAQAVAVPTNSLVARALARTPRFIKEGAKEALPEGLQGGQEQVAGNLALQNEGFDRPTFAGAAGAFTMEALAGAGVGAAVSPLTSSARVVRQAEEEAKRSDAEDRLAGSQSVDEMVKAANDLAMAPLDVPQMDEGRALDRLDALRAQDEKGLRQFGRGGAPVPSDGAQAADDPRQAPEATATLVDAPFGDRILTLREQLADPDVRAAIREQFGADGLNNATYYAGVADKVGPDTLPEKTRDNLLSVAEQMVRAAILKPIGTRPLTDQRPPGALALPAPSDEGGGGPRSIGLDTAPTGRFRVDAEGNAAPETRADVLSARDRERQRQAQREGLSGIAPRGAAPQTSPLVEQQRAARRRTEAQPLDGLDQADPVLSYVESLRQINTPAARAFVSEFQAGRITRRDIIEVMQSQPADPLGSFSTQGVPADNASERLRRARDEGRARRQETQAAEVQPLQPAPAPETGGVVVAPGMRARPRAVDTTPEVMESDLTTGDGMPYGTKSGASVRARREGLGPENVVEIPGAGWVVRPAEPNAAEVQPMEAQSEPVGDMATTPAVPAAAGTGRAPDAGRGGVAVGRVPADPGRGVQGAAETPVAGGAEAARAGDGGGADAALSDRLKAVKPKPADGVSRAASGGQVGVNGYEYKGGQFLPSTQLPPGSYRDKDGTVRKGNKGEQIEPGKREGAPSPTSRSIYGVIGGYLRVDRETGAASIVPNVRDNMGFPVTPETLIRPGVKGLTTDQQYTLQELVDLYNKGARWIDLDLAKPSATTPPPTAERVEEARGGEQAITEARQPAAESDTAAALTPAASIDTSPGNVEAETANQPVATELAPAQPAAASASTDAQQGRPRTLPPLPVPAYRVERRYSNGAVVRPLPGKTFAPEQVTAISDWFKAAGWEVSTRAPSGVSAANYSGMTADDVPEYYTAKQRRRDEAAQAADEKASAKKAEQAAYLSTSPAGAFVTETFGDALNGSNSAALAKFLDGTETTFGGLLNFRAADALESMGIAAEGRAVKDILDDIKRQYEATQPAPDAAAQATPQATAPTPSPAQEPAPPKTYPELEGKTIEQEMEVEGHKVVRRRDAAKAMRALDEREASLRSLLDCLKGGG